jgi:hypothetical protein|tara:strand:- start:391 stop:3765 length:3375 start_codon:yes stop_codon:yes gene_type:complete
LGSAWRTESIEGTAYKKAFLMPSALDESPTSSEEYRRPLLDEGSYWTHEVGEEEWEAFNPFKFTSDIDEQSIIINAQSEEQARYLLKLAEEERADIELLSRAGIGKVLAANVIATLGSPSEWLMLAVGGAFLKPATLGIRAAKYSGIGLATGTAREVALHQMQNYRTVEQSFFNIGAETFLTGVIGGALGRRLPSKARERATAAFERDMDHLADPDNTTPYVSKAFLDDLNTRRAADEIDDDRYVAEILKEEQRMLRVKGQGFLRWVRQTTPIGDLSMAVSPTLVKITERLVGIPFFRKIDEIRKNHIPVQDRANMAVARSTNERQSILSTLEKEMHGVMKGKELADHFEKAYRYGHTSDHAPVNRAIQKLEAHRKVHEEAYVGAGLIPAANAKAIAEAEKAIVVLGKQIKALDKDIATRSKGLDEATKVKELDEQVATLSKQKSAITKEVARLKKLRPKDPAAKKDVATRLASSVKEEKKLANQLTKAREARKDIKPRVARLQKKVIALQEKRAARQKDLDETIVPEKTGVIMPFGDVRYMPTVWSHAQLLDNKDLWLRVAMQDVKDQAAGPFNEAVVLKSLEKAYRSIMSTSSGFSDISIPLTSARTKTRSLKLRSERFREVDAGEGKTVTFIETGLARLFDRHDREMQMLLKLHEAGFNKEGKAALIKKVNDEYNDILGGEMSTRQRNRINRERTRLLTKLEGVFETLMGRKGLGQQGSILNEAGAAVRSLNVMRVMGSVPITSLTDIGSIIGRRGLGRTVGMLFKLATATKATRAELARLSTASEIAGYGRLTALQMNDDVAPMGRRVASAFDQGAKHLFKWSGMTHWNQFTKDLVSLTYADELIRYALNPAMMKRNQRMRFNKAGFGDEEFKEIGRLFRKYGEEVDGLHVPNIDRWLDEYGKPLPIADYFLSALKRESEIAIVTPGAGDLPMAMRTPLGRMVGQFKSFSFAAFNRVTVPQTQLMFHGDGRAAAGMISMIGIGGMIYGMKQTLKGQEITTDPEELVREALDRAGYFGIMADFSALAEKISGDALGHLPFGYEVSKYHSRNLSGDLLGPSVGWGEDVGRTFTNIVGTVFDDKNWTDADVRAARRLVPFQNLWQNSIFFNDMKINGFLRDIF